MDAAATAAWIAAAIAGGAAFIALVAANYSRRQAGAAETQAQAAQDQVALLRKQVDMAEQDRHEQDAPQFAITWSPNFGSYGDDGEWFTITYVAGQQRLDKVTVAPAPSSEVKGLSLNENERPELSSIELMSMSGGVARKFVASLDINDDSGVVFLVSAEAGAKAWGPVPVTATDDD